MSDKNQKQLVYGLDIGTRSIVGTVGYRNGKQFIVVAQTAKEHETRAMLDGQIHDIGQVAETIKEVTARLQEMTGTIFNQVCIAAAGRVLRTLQVHTEMKLEEERTITEEDIYTLHSMAIEDAYKEFIETNSTELKFYCVGSSVVRYYLNDFAMSNLEGHKAKSIGIDLIATFLPDEVVDGLYKAVDRAGLEVASMTLEPIAAITLAIPDRFRLLNIALVDVGAGTSDISITKEGTIIAFGMIPTAGDSLTETIANHCMVDFNTAEVIKKAASDMDVIPYEDIMGIPMSITKKELTKVVANDVEKMAALAAEKICELNGDKPVGAVFVVGGGGAFPGYTELLAKKLGLVKERVALRGKEVMNDIVFKNTDLEINSLLVTPIGICLSFYEETNNFVYVSFNNTKVKIYNNNSLTVMDVAMQTDFPSNGFFPKSGKALEYTLNGVEKMARGYLGEPATIKVNGELANMNTPIKENDIIEVIESVPGEPAKLTIGQLNDFKSSINIVVNDKAVKLPKFATVNGELKSEFYEIKEHDIIEILDYYTPEQIAEFMDLEISAYSVCMVNNMKADNSTKVYENFSVRWDESKGDSYNSLPEDDGEYSPLDKNEEEKPNETVSPSISSEEEQTAEENSTPAIPHDITVIVNKMPVKMSGKANYVFVDVFDYIDFDLSSPQGNIVTKINGQAAAYMEEIFDGAVIDIYWEKV